MTPLTLDQDWAHAAFFNTLVHAIWDRSDYHETVDRLFTPVDEAAEHAGQSVFHSVDFVVHAADVIDR